MRSDNQWLINYLNEVLSLEVEIHSTKALVEQLESMRVELMYVPDKFVPPDKPTRPEPPKEPQKPKKDDGLSAFIAVAQGAKDQLLRWLEGGAGFVAIILGLLFPIFLAIAIFSEIYWVSTLWWIILFMFLGFVGTIIVCIAIGTYDYLETTRNLETKYNADLKKYKSEKSNYENLCRQRLIRYKAECETLQQQFVERKNYALVNNQLAFLFNNKINSTQLQLETQLAVLESSLKSLYEMDVIHPQYHNLVAASSIVSYLETGRCDSLHGADGAYDTYEDALLQERIISELVEIKAKLDQIKDMQYRLFVELSRANETLTAIKSSIHEGFQVLQAQAKTNARRFLELSGDISQMNLDMGNCFQDVEEYLAKLEKTSDKALAYLKEQGK